MFRFLVLLGMLFTPMLGFSQMFVSTPDKVIATDDGLYVEVEGECLPVESITMTEEGYIVAVPHPQAAICPICRSKKYVQGRICPVCGFPLGD